MVNVGSEKKKKNSSNTNNCNIFNVKISKSMCLPATISVYISGPALTPEK